MDHAAEIIFQRQIVDNPQVSVRAGKNSQLIPVLPPIDDQGAPSRQRQSPRGRGMADNPKAGASLSLDRHGRIFGFFKERSTCREVPQGQLLTRYLALGGIPDD